MQNASAETFYIFVPQANRFHWDFPAALTDWIRKHDPGQLAAKTLRSFTLCNETVSPAYIPFCLHCS